MARVLIERGFAIVCPSLGMNFEKLPLLKDPWGFEYFILLTVLMSSVIVGFFKRIGWL
jgi:Mg2+ and Co2+ transporter CorA